MTETLTERIQRHEGYREMPYQDTLGNWTVGIGHLITQAQASTTYSAGIDYADALNLLEADIARCTDQADTQISCFEALNAVRQDVIIEMVFWIGIGGVLKFHNMLAALENGDWDGASKELLDSLLHKQIPGRAEELAGIMLKGVVE